AYGAGEAGRDYNYADMSEARLADRYLPPYRAAVEAGASCIMPSFNSVNGVPSIANRRLTQHILREQWGFDGLIVSDYGAVGELIAHGLAEDEAQAAYLALNAGCDFEMMSACYLHGLETLLAEGKITMAQIDERVLRILEYKEKLGLFENPYGQADPELEMCALSPAHRVLAREAAEKSAVLLKNDEILPLSDKIRRLALIGPFADTGAILGGWAVNGDPSKTVTIRQGLCARLPDTEIRVLSGCGNGLKEEETEDAEEVCALARWADAVILCLGEDGTQAGEGKSRTELSISPAQQKLSDLVHAENPRTAVLLLTGRPLAVEKLDRQAHAILCLWQPGTEGGSAAARLLFGDTVPCGHLPMTFPRTTGQEPISYDEYSTGRPALDRFDPEKNSFRSAWIDAPLAPLYPFGFGLSYTDYELSDEALSSEMLTEDGEIEARCTVKNTGNRAGEALVQLYIRDLHASVVRPVRELKGFEKLSLAPGEEKIVRFALTEPMLRFMTPDNGFASEKGKFEVYLSMDSQSGKALSFRLV
ncbi:MAG: glycoside hydrolase family 3 C-terminal domain-containing protein, partial [Oscillospiraceae bacterium]|nr:glycoside hydrolase family 3 C-terminal domain-containing protein [Oscillospiraceae bacterium]